MSKPFPFSVCKECCASTGGGTVDVDEINEILSNKIGVWKPKTDYKKGDVVFAPVRNSMGENELTWCIFECLIDHTSPNGTSPWDMENGADYWYLQYVTVAGAYSDSKGRTIHTTYATKEEMQEGLEQVETKADKTAYATFHDGETISLTDNTEYKAAEPISTLTLTYPTNDFICSLYFTLASSGTITVTLPESKYIGETPDFKNGETWELSIKNGVVVGGKVV